MKSQRPVQYVRDASALETLVADLAASERIALDTEFMRERTYYARLCLVQVATDELMAVVDPLACEDLKPLWQVVTGGPEVIFHAASQDLEIIVQESGALPSTHFDTQVAASFLGYGDSIGHSRLVASLTGNSLGRSEAYTDWARRPLSQEQVDYALDDVRYLLSMRDRLGSELEAAGRTSWVREELADLASRIRAEPDAENLWRRVKGGRGLKGGKLAVLRELAAWREREAQRRDIPRQRVLPDHVLAEVSRRTPRRLEQIERLRGVNPHEARRSGDALLAAVARGLEMPQDQHPDWGAPAPHAADPRIDAFAALLDSVLRSRSRDLQLSSRLLAKRADLEALVRFHLSGLEEEPDLPVLSGWRRDCVGNELLSVLRGDLAAVIVTDEHGPTMQLVPHTEA